MRDKERLMCAAKAAGILFNPTVTSKHGLLVALNPSNQGDTRFWNPGNDDGDSFRLLVKLNLNVFSVNNTAYASDAESFHEYQVGHEGDPAAATRRAILMCAASIGKQMEDV